MWCVWISRRPALPEEPGNQPGGRLALRQDSSIEEKEGTCSPYPAKRTVEHHPGQG